MEQRRQHPMAGEEAHDAPENNRHARPNIHGASPLTGDLHRVGGGFSVRFYLAGKQGTAITLGCEWHPHVPSRRDARRKVDLDRYRYARHQFLEAIAERLGGTVLCVEWPGGEGAQT